LLYQGHSGAAAESDPDFGKKAAQQLDKRKKVIVYCNRGGTLKVGFGNERKFFKDDPERMFGIESRSLKGCYELLEVGLPCQWASERLALNTVALPRHSYTE
jgi:hypothetical protein